MSFHTTRWSVVRAAGAPRSDGVDGAARRAALGELCAAYWPPVYAFVRRTGATPVLAEDLTQSFFARLLERDDLATADPARGRFRGFLVGALRHFLANERERQRALKRGGGAPGFTLDAAAVRALESGAALEPASLDATPERAFERAWAEAVLARARARLEAELEHAGKGAQWRALEPWLAVTDERGHVAEVARGLGSSENAVRVALHRLRRRFGELVRDEVRDTVGPGEVEDEVRELLRAFA
jgi:RNA polymerase sigma factor (sigma-70 family)